MSSENWQFFTPSPLFVVFLLSKIFNLKISHSKKCPGFKALDDPGGIGLLIDLFAHIYAIFVQTSAKSVHAVACVKSFFHVDLPWHVRPF